MAPETQIRPAGTRRVAGALGVVAVVAGLTAACTSSSDSGPGPTTSASASASTASPSASSTTSGPIAPSYTLNSNSNVGLTGGIGKLAAEGGHMTLTASPDGSTRVVVDQVQTKGAPWTLDLTLGSNARAISGTIQVAGINWNVVPTTGVVSSVVSSKAAEITTVQAVTVNSGDSSTNRPMVLALAGKAN